MATFFCYKLKYRLPQCLRYAVVSLVSTNRLHTHQMNNLDTKKCLPASKSLEFCFSVCALDFGPCSYQARSDSLKVQSPVCQWAVRFSILEILLQPDFNLDSSLKFELHHFITVQSSYVLIIVNPITILDVNL